MQKTTALARKEQVSAEVGELLRKANLEPTSRSVSSSKSSKRTPDLAQLISKATRDTKRQAQEEKAYNSEEEEGEESGFYKENFSVQTNFGRI